MMRPKALAGGIPMGSAGVVVEPAAHRIVAVGGGKGGVGKSLVASNLAAALALAGHKTVLVDADLGAANLHTLLGVDKVGPTLHGLFDHRITSLNQAQVSTPIPNLSLVPGVSAMPGAANISHSQKQKLLRHLGALQAHVVVVDIGAGVSFNMVDIFNAADIRLVVVTPQMTSIQNAYAFLKSSVHRTVRDLPFGEKLGGILDAQGGKNGSKMSNVLESLRAEGPALARSLEDTLAAHGAYLVANQLMENRDAGVAHAVSRMVHDFLGVEAPVLAQVKSSRKICDSVNRRQPAVLMAEPGDAAAAFVGLAAAIMAVDVKALRHQRASAMERALVAGAFCARTEPLPSALEQYARRHPRHMVEMDVHIGCGAVDHPARVLDLSLCGALLETQASIAVGQELCVHFGEHAPRAKSLKAVVRRLPAPQQLGVEFDAKDHPEDLLDELMERLAPGAPAAQEHPAQPAA